MGLYIIVPAYNEEKNILNCINDWYPVVEQHNADGNSRLIVINDGSTDQTFEVLESLARTRPLLIPISKDNGGHGSAVLYGYRYAIAHKADWVFQTDSDGQTNPREFVEFWKNREYYDAIIGNRVNRGDGRIRKAIEDIVCTLLRIIFGVKIEDANAPFRLIKATLIKKYIDKLPKDYNLPNIMFTTFFVYFNEKTLFLPITFQPRKAGINSINFKRIIRIGISAVRDFYSLRRRIDIQ